MHGTSDFPRFIQWNTWSCAIRCVQAILAHYGQRAPYRLIKGALGTDREGTTLAQMQAFFEKNGWDATALEEPLDTWGALLDSGALLIPSVDGNHVVVVHGMDDETVYVADPSIRRLFGRKQRRDVFNERWDGEGLAVRPLLQYRERALKHGQRRG